MKQSSLKLLFVLTFCFATVVLFAQKRFQLTIHLPKGINKEKLEAFLDDGMKMIRIKLQPSTETQLLLTGDYYSVYAAITIQYPPQGAVKGFAKDFFVGETPGTITFNESSVNEPFANYSLQNVFDFEKEKEQMDNYCAAERKKTMDYEAQYGDKLFNTEDTAVRNYYWNVLVKELGRKKLEFIQNNTGSYYSFYIFRTEVARRLVISADSLLIVLNSFPDKFKYSDEGNLVSTFLHGRQLLSGNTQVIDFTAKDINKKMVSLSQFKANKCVLLHFWATWCTPCMHELPAVKKISEQYKSKDLQIISVALPSAKYSDYLAAIKKQGMDWINIYNDDDLMIRYGDQPTPRICLIDKNGKLVYDHLGYDEKNDPQLNELNEKLKELLH